MSGEELPKVFAGISTTGYPPSVEKAQPWKQWVTLVDEKALQASVVAVPQDICYGSVGLGGY